MGFRVVIWFFTNENVFILQYTTDQWDRCVWDLKKNEWLQSNEWRIHFFVFICLLLMTILKLINVYFYVSIKHERGIWSSPFTVNKYLDFGTSYRRWNKHLQCKYLCWQMKVYALLLLLDVGICVDLKLMYSWRFDCWTLQCCLWCGVVSYVNANIFDVVIWLWFMCLWMVLECSMRISA